MGTTNDAKTPTLRPSAWGAADLERIVIVSTQTLAAVHGSLAPLVKFISLQLSTDNPDLVGLGSYSVSPLMDCLGRAVIVALAPIAQQGRAPVTPQPRDPEIARLMVDGAQAARVCRSGLLKLFRPREWQDTYWAKSGSTESNHCQ